MYSLIVLEVRSSKSGCQQGCTPFEGSGGILLASSHPSWFQALLGHHIPLVSPSLFPWLPLVSMFLRLSDSGSTLSHLTLS